MRSPARSTWRTWWPVLLLASVAGCTEPRHLGPPPAPSAPSAPAPSAEAAAPEPTPKAEPSSGFIVGRRTQDIRPAEAEEAKGAHVTTPRITAKDPITLQGNAYVTAIGQTSILQIQHAMDLYKATNDRYPKDYDEFMNEIIKANNIALPQLPYYQKYGYDANEHKLVILEYPH